MKRITKTLIILFISIVYFNADAQVLGSLYFNGDDNYVKLVNNPLNEIADGDFTFEAWIKGKDSEQTSHPMIFSNRGSNAFDGGVSIFLHNQWGGSTSKMLSIQIDAQNYLFVNNGSFEGSLLDDECHHIAISRKENTLTFFIDGTLIGTSTPTNLGSISNDAPLWIGKDQATNNTFNGIISQCRIWNITRTLEEISLNKDISLQGDEMGLKAYWEMDNESSQFVSDKTGQFDGLLGNSDQMEDQDPLWTQEGCIEEAILSTDNIRNSFIKISPNPTSGFITIQNLGNENIQFELINQIGKKLLNKTMNSPSMNLDISDFPSGIYFVNAFYRDQIISKKIVKF